MSEIYVKRDGVSYQADISIYSTDGHDATWKVVIDGDDFYFETGTSYTFAELVREAQKVFNETLDWEEAQKELVQENSNKDRDASKADSDVAKLAESLLIPLGAQDDFAKAIGELLSSAGRTEAEEYWKGLVETFLVDLGFEDESILSIIIKNGEIEVTYYEAINEANVLPAIPEIKVDVFKFGGNR